MLHGLVGCKKKGLKKAFFYITTLYLKSSATNNDCEKQKSFLLDSLQEK